MVKKQRELKMEFEEWLQYGVENGFCTNKFCATHDEIPMHKTEERAWDEGGDPCQHVVRLGSSIDWELPDWYFDDNFTIGGLS